MAIPVREFLDLVRQGLGKDPEMPIDVNAYAEKVSIDPRTAYRHIRHYRALIRSLREEGLEIHVRKLRK
jgi:hypothetical protein